jgi:hypothetical protein
MLDKRVAQRNAFERALTEVEWRNSSGFDRTAYPAKSIHLIVRACGISRAMCATNAGSIA